MTTSEIEPSRDGRADGRTPGRLGPWAWLAVALAVVVRVAFLGDKPFWRDEAWVALLVGHPMAAVSGSRAVPFGFLLVTRALAAAPGVAPEVAMRVVPLACGIAAVPLLGRLAIALGSSRRAAIAAMWLAAGLQPLVYYSRELKSYGIDFLLAILLPLLLLEGFLATDPRPPARRALPAALAVTPWISFGGIFSACALLGWGWLAGWTRFDAARRRAWLLGTAAFALSFGAVFAFVLRAQASDPWMHTYWTHRLLATGDASLAWRTGTAAWRYGTIVVGFLFPVGAKAFLALAAVGAVAGLDGRRLDAAGLFAATAAACIAASVTDHYLIAQGRHLLFAAPILVVWVAAGLDRISRSLPATLRAVVVAGLPAVLAVAWSVRSIEHRVLPMASNPSTYFRYDVLQDMPGLLAAATPLVHRGEPVLVTTKCSYPFQYYGRGRLAQAVFCERECGDFHRVARRWLRQVRTRGWVLLTEEEPVPFGRLLAKEGFEHVEKASVRGLRLWEVRRPATRGRPQGGGHREPFPTRNPLLDDWPR